MIDKTKEYILQCKRAIDVQRIWEPNGGDFYVISVGGPKDVQIVCYENWKYLYSQIVYRFGRYVWLPRQDQLQGMVKNRWATIWGMFTGLQGWIRNTAIIHKNWSMEQLWLAFVMKEKFNKTWNGIDWDDE